MISKALYLVIVFSMNGYPDEFYKERVREDITLIQCTVQAQQVMPRIYNMYDGYKIKTFGCMTEDQLRDALNKRD
jgi:hypothetical protein